MRLRFLAFCDLNHFYSRQQPEPTVVTRHHSGLHFVPAPWCSASGCTKAMDLALQTWTERAVS